MGGNIDPYINIIFEPIVGDQPQIVSLIIFAWSDVLDVGIPEEDGLVHSLSPFALRLTVNRKFISAIRRQLSVDCVRKNIMESFSWRMRRLQGPCLQKRLIFRNRRVGNITLQKQIIIVLRRWEWAMMCSITRSWNGAMHLANSMPQSILNCRFMEPWRLCMLSSARYGDFFTINIAKTFCRFRCQYLTSLLMARTTFPQSLHS